MWRVEGGGIWTHHGPHVMAHCLANGAAHENYICNSEHETAACVVGQGACPKGAEKSTKRRSGSDQFLARGETLYVSLITRTQRSLRSGPFDQTRAPLDQDRNRW